MSSLAGRVAVVAGATRGSGRGIARALGEAGATVYCTGRSTAAQRSSYDRPETIDETAALVDEAGGTGIAVRVDHGNDGEVRDLLDRVASQHGRLDILVDSVAGMDPELGGWDYWSADLSNGGPILHRALVSHLITAKHAIPLMTREPGGLLVEVTEGDTLGAGGNFLTFLVKGGLKLFALALAESVRPKQLTVVAATPGFLRSEVMLEHFGVTEATWRDGVAKDPNFLQSETPILLGRGLAALAADPKRFERTGMLLSSWELARHYQVDDIDGRRPDWGAHLPSVVDTIPGFREVLEHEAEWHGLLEGRLRSALGTTASE